MLLMARRGAALSQLALRSVGPLSAACPATPAAFALLATATEARSYNQQHHSKPSYGLALGAAGAALYGSLVASSADAPPAEAAPKVVADPYAKPSELKGLPKKIVLYQYAICPFCYKVKTFLDYHKIPYTTIEVNPLTKAELKWSTTYKKVPVVKLDDGEVVVDSSAIVSRLAAEVEALQRQQAPPKPARKASSWLLSFGGKSSEPEAPDAAAEEERERRWRKWVDERLVRLITANIYRNWRESWQTMGYISDVVNWGLVNREAARSAGAIMMWQVGKRLPKKYNIEGDLREALYAAIGEFLAEVGAHPFLGGERPNLADLAAFGVLRTIVGTDTFADVMANTDVAPWYDRMRGVVGPSACVVALAGAAEISAAAA